MGRIAAIGLDAAERTLLEPMMDQGLLPNLAAIRDKSARCHLENVVAYRSELPWTQFLTGRTAEANRYWSTVAFDPATYEAVTVGALEETPFYGRGLVDEAIVFDVPHSVLRDEVPGVQVTAWGAHSAQYVRASRPAGLLRQIDDTFGPHPGFDNDYEGTWSEPAFLESLTDALVKGASTRIEVVQWLMQRQPDWDLLMTVMSETHSIGHHCWHGVDDRHPLHHTGHAPRAKEHLHRVLQEVDDAVGRLVAELGDDTTVVLFSLHGMQPNENDLPSTVLLPELLHRLRFGKGLFEHDDPARWAQRGHPPVDPGPTNPWARYMRHRFAETPRAALERALRRRLPDRAYTAYRRLFGVQPPRPSGELRNQIPPETDVVAGVSPYRESLLWQIPSWYRQHWPTMEYFVLPTFSDGHLRINVKGREANGIVDPDDYEATCAEIEELLRACTNPRTGNPAVAEVLRMRVGRDEIMAADGPDSDVVVLWAEPLDALHHPTVGTVGPFPFLRTGEHSNRGFAYVSGPGIEPTDLGERSAFDLTATIVDLLGKPVPDDFEGTTLLGDVAQR